MILLDVDPATPGIQTTVSLDQGITEIPVDVVIQNAQAIGAFEFELALDAIWLRFLRWEEGPFLGITERATVCQVQPSENSLRIGCNSYGAPAPEGPSGDGHLGTIYFQPRLTGQTCLIMLLVETATVFGDPLPTTDQNACLTIAPNTPTPTPTSTPTVTPVVGGATRTPSLVGGTGSFADPSDPALAAGSGGSSQPVVGAALGGGLLAGMSAAGGYWYIRRYRCGCS